MLYLRNNQSLSEIVFKNHTSYFEKSAFSVAKAICERKLFTYETRAALTKKKLQVKVRIPIYINKEILLIPTKSPKNYDCIWLNYFNIVKVIKKNHYCEVVFSNLQTLTLKESYSKIMKSLKVANLISNYILNIEKSFFIEN